MGDRHLKFHETRDNLGRPTGVAFVAEPPMTIPRGTSRQLDETLARLNREHLLVIELGDLADLIVEPARNRSSRNAARRSPESTTWPRHWPQRRRFRMS